RFAGFARAAVAMTVAVAPRQHPRQLLQGEPIHLALELDHRVERNPELVPTPGIELRMAAGAQVDVRVAPDQLQQEPDLLLAAVAAPPLAPHPVLGDVVAQPLAGAADHANVLGPQADFLVQLAEHRLFGRLAALDPALRELPGMLTDPLAPEDLVPRVDQDDA